MALTIISPLESIVLALLPLPPVMKSLFCATMVISPGDCGDLPSPPPGSTTATSVDILCWGAGPSNCVCSLVHSFFLSILLSREARPSVAHKKSLCRSPCTCCYV
eukprot:TRINITY_DN2554_c0_g1_i4.p3 TRINITY_DN2554_c0_g1~~TRINITY_DN2554_c0_g1_i4.p3  ORF type:complete len:105 (+),score=3.98 TRINITY_DN2554_c0_g1_i4:1295-1609(+)